MSNNKLAKNKARLEGSAGTGRQLFGFPLWLVLGLAALLGLAVLSMAVHNASREHGHVTRIYLDRADSLIWALEAGTRTWMGWQSERALLQPLIEETADQPGIVYMAVVSRAGVILAHSDSARVGRTIDGALLPPGAPPEKAQWRILDAPGLLEGESLPVFEVYREFSPVRDNWRRGPRRHMMEERAHGRHMMAPRSDQARDAGPARRDWRDWRDGGQTGNRDDSSTFAMVGFALQPYAAALKGDRANSIFTAALVAALALGGILCLFWAYSYRRSRRLLKNTQALAAEVMNSMPLGLITTDPRGNIGQANPEALRLLGLSAGETAGRPLDSLPGQNWRDMAEKLKRKRRLPEQEAALPWPAGPKPVSPRPVSLSASQIRGENGEFLGCVVLIRDIAEMKRLQEELRRGERLGVLGSLAAGVAHEIRNPLSSIKGLATYLAQKAPAGGPEEEAARTMVAEVGRLNRVVTELLEFSRPAAVQAAETDVNAVIERALRLAGADLQAKDIRVDYRPEPGFPKARLDGERLTQALLNLFLNAVQAMADGGNLRVTLERDEDQRRFRLGVRDTGGGIAPADMASIFTPYFTTKASGTGLGLAIVQQIAEGHGGRVLVESKPGEGSAFTLLLPLDPADNGDLSA